MTRQVTGQVTPQATAARPSELPVEFGNAGDLETHGTGWFIGFSDWTRGPSSMLRHVPTGADLRDLCVKWFAHPAGHPAGEAKPLSEGRTMSMLVGVPGEFRIEFCAVPGFDNGAVQSHTLRRNGDFAIWGAGVWHRAFGLQPTTILTIRWQD